MTKEFSTKTVAHCLVLAAIETMVIDEVVEDRSEDAIAKLQEKRNGDVLEIIFFDILETTINGLRFVSEPTNQEHRVLVEPEEVEKRISAGKEKIMQAVDGLLSHIEELAAASEEEVKAPKVPHTLH